jgi:Ca2+-transporting ATPase
VPDTGLGLSSREAARRLLERGPNRLPDPPRRGLATRVGEQVRDPMILLLLAAAALTAVLHDTPNTVIIAAVVVFNTGAGVVQQLRAERAMAALRQLVASVSQVRRDGVFLEVPSDQIVPGDLVRISAGDVVPADGRLLEANELQVDEARMTGESLPVELLQGTEITGGTMVTRGRAAMEVTKTGAHSGIGRIAALLASTTQRRTPLQRRLARLSRTLVAAVVSLTAVVVGSGLLQGRPVPEMVVVGLSLAVAAVPESLPAVVTVALAMGAHRMASRRAVVSSLPAVETLGSVTVVATDKTGTITEGTMLAEHVWTPTGSYSVTGGGYAPSGTLRPTEDASRDTDPELERLLRAVSLCNDAELRSSEGTWSVVGDPLEGALLALAGKGNQPAETWRTTWPRIGEQPFDHRSRRMVTEHRNQDGVELTICKGAPEAVLALLPDDEDAERASAAADRLAGLGYRVIAVADSAKGSADGRLTLAGLVAIGDPPRPQAPKVVEALKRAGIRLVLVTGDHPGTAEAIARRVGIAGPGDRAVDGALLTAEGAPPGTELTVIARVQPEQKVTVVETLQQQGEIVAMLGDGVNDAPALRRADIGVAAGHGGTEVAKQASDLVLMDDDLGTVVSAVQEGRRIFANIRAFLTYAISGGLAEVGVMLLGPAIGLVLPLLPGQILWINLLTHGLTGVAFGAEPPDPRDMAQPPRPPSESIFTAKSRVALVVATIALTGTALLVGAFSAEATADRRTAIFVVLGLGQLGVALALRAGGRSRRLRDRGLELAVATAATLQLSASYVPWLRDLLSTTVLPVDTLLLVLLTAAVPGVLVRVVVGLTQNRPHKRGA